MAYVGFKRSMELLGLGLKILQDDGYDLNQSKEELKGYILSSTQALFERIDTSNIVNNLEVEGSKLKQVMDNNSLGAYLKKRVNEEVMKSMKLVAYEGVKSGFLIVFQRTGIKESYINSFLSKFEEANKNLESRQESFRAE